MYNLHIYNSQSPKVMFGNNNKLSEIYMVAIYLFAPLFFFTASFSTQSLESYIIQHIWEELKYHFVKYIFYKTSFVCIKDSSKEKKNEMEEIKYNSLYTDKVWSLKVETANGIWIKKTSGRNGLPSLYDFIFHVITVNLCFILQ